METQRTPEKPRHLSAISVSASIRQDLQGGPPLPLRVSAAFDDAWNLMAEDSRVVVVVSRAIGDGPLNIVLEGSLPPLLPPAGTTGWINAQSLRVGDIAIDLVCPEWQPRPDWDALRRRYPTVCACAPDVARRARSIASPLSLLAVHGDEPTPAARAHVLATFQDVLRSLPTGETWPPSLLEAAARRLTGLGWGLTPCGDDWLAGLLVWLWLAHPQPAEASAAIVRAAASRTTALSAAFLRCAGRGELDAAWHDLLAALAWGEPSAWDAALRPVLAHGATSGADRLAGFLYPLCGGHRARRAHHQPREHGGSVRRPGRHAR